MAGRERWRWKWNGKRGTLKGNVLNFTTFLISFFTPFCALAAAASTSFFFLGYFIHHSNSAYTKRCSLPPIQRHILVSYEYFLNPFALAPLLVSPLRAMLDSLWILEQQKYPPTLARELFGGERGRSTAEVEKFSQRDYYDDEESPDKRHRSEEISSFGNFWWDHHHHHENANVRRRKQENSAAKKNCSQTPFIVGTENET